MARETARCKEDHIHADILSLHGITMSNCLCCCGNSRKPVVVNGEIKFFTLLSPFDFDEGNQAATPCDQVDFTRGCLHACVEDVPSLGAQPKCSARLTVATALFGNLAFNQAFRSIARA